MTRVTDSACGLASMESIEDLASRLGMSAEHVLLETDEMRLEGVESARQLIREIGFRDRLRGFESKLALFDDGYLSCVVTGPRRFVRRCAFDVRCIDPQPVVARRFARRLRNASMSLAALALVAAAAANAGIWREATMPVALVSGAFVPVALWLFLARRKVRYSFQTLHGRAPAVTLAASFGSTSACRTAALALADAIRHVQRLNPMEKRQLLRKEIQEHYRLLRNGIISTAACRAALDRTLASF